MKTVIIATAVREAWQNRERIIRQARRWCRGLRDAFTRKKGGKNEPVEKS